jgi:ABC-type polysaccharide/polyol phosphate export permease
MWIDASPSGMLENLPGQAREILNLQPVVHLTTIIRVGRVWIFQYDYIGVIN